VQVAARIEAAQGEGFLRALRAEWEGHNKSVHMIRDILMYMDRIYVKQQVRRAVGVQAAEAVQGALCVAPAGLGASSPRHCKNIAASFCYCSTLDVAAMQTQPRSHLPAPLTPPPPQQKTSVHQLGLDLWRDVVVRNRRIRERLLGMLLDMVQVCV
jgi:hypothetical protein